MTRGSQLEIVRFVVRYWYGIGALTIINHDAPLSTAVIRTTAICLPDRARTS